VGFDPVVGLVSNGLALGTPAYRVGCILSDPLGFRTFGALRFVELSNLRGRLRIYLLDSSIGWECAVLIPEVCLISVCLPRQGTMTHLVEIHHINMPVHLDGVL
jgi:hypothetical protein